MRRSRCSAALCHRELVFSEGGLVDIQVLDDSGLPLPEALEEPLVDLLNQIGQLPVLGSLTNQEDESVKAALELPAGSYWNMHVQRIGDVEVVRE